MKPDADENKDVEQLKRKLEETKKEVKDNYARLLRVAADFENYKKRTTREKEELAKFANEDLMKAILPFVDNLERALNHSEKTKDVQSLIEGVILTIRNLVQALNKFGLSPIDSVGKPFDPAVHEALVVVETDQHQPNQSWRNSRKVTSSTIVSSDRQPFLCQKR